MRTRRKIAVSILSIAYLCVLTDTLTTPVLALSKEDLSNTMSTYWEKTKEVGKEVAGAVKEHGPEWVETAKDKAGAAIDKGKEVVGEAQDKISTWNQQQQDEFWAREDQLLNGGTQSTEASGEASAAPAVPEEVPELTEWAEADANIADHSTPKLETGFYTLNGLLVYYDAETDTLKPVTTDNSNNQAESTGETVAPKPEATEAEGPKVADQKTDAKTEVETEVEAEPEATESSLGEAVTHGVLLLAAVVLVIGGLVALLVRKFKPTDKDALDEWPF